jgi:DNA-directed RNA polymerase subunit RPC12/RpoP
MQEPFRCIACGAASRQATRCRECGGRSFELAKPVVSKRTDADRPAPLLSLAAAREMRARRRSD